MDGVHCVVGQPEAEERLHLPRQAHGRGEDCGHGPNTIVYRKMEGIIEALQSPVQGVPIKTVNSFINKIPSVFTGADLVAWLQAHLAIADPAEAVHFATLLASHGYLFPIEDHILAVKNDTTSLYRFQTRYFWPSNCWAPENTDYAVYLCKRTMQNKTRLELADYEAENLARLQKMFSRKWEFIFMQAEAQSKVDKKRDKQERKILDTQERAFWDVYRPPPGQLSTTELDIKKMYRLNHVFSMCSDPGERQEEASSLALLTTHLPALTTRRDRRTVKVSKCAETFVEFLRLYEEYDPLLCCLVGDPSPWVSDVWEREERGGCEAQPRRVQRWAFSGWELLRDPAGRDHFLAFLERELSPHPSPLTSCKILF